MKNRIYAFGAAMCGLLLPAAALADDDEQMTLSPEAVKSQRNVLIFIGVAAIVGVGFYFFRRWQTIHSGNTVEGGYNDD